MQSGNGNRACTVDASRRGAGTGATSVVDEESELESVMAMMNTKRWEIEIRHYKNQRSSLNRKFKLTDEVSLSLVYSLPV